MKNYIGCKIIKAIPMNIDEFNKKYNRNIKPSNNESEGYLVWYPDGYTSWSPKTTFNNSYRLISDEEFDFMNT